MDKREAKKVAYGLVALEILAALDGQMAEAYTPTAEAAHKIRVALMEVKSEMERRSGLDLRTIHPVREVYRDQ